MSFYLSRTAEHSGTGWEGSQLFARRLLCGSAKTDLSFCPRAELSWILGPVRSSSFSSYHQQQAGLQKGGGLAGGLGLLTRNAALCPFFGPPTPVLLCSPESYRMLLWKTRRRIRIPMLTCGQWSPVPRKYVLEPLQFTKCFFTLVGLASVRSRALS